MLLFSRVEWGSIGQASGDTEYSVAEPAYKGQSLFASANDLPSLGTRMFQSHPPI